MAARNQIIRKWRQAMRKGRTGEQKALNLLRELGIKPHQAPTEAWDVQLGPFMINVKYGENFYISGKNILRLVRSEGTPALLFIHPSGWVALFTLSWFYQP